MTVRERASNPGPRRRPKAAAVPPACPFVYANGKRCTGHITRIDAGKANAGWELKDGAWTFGLHASYYGLTCSERGGHNSAGSRFRDQRMELAPSQLPEDIAVVIDTVR